MTYSPRSPRLVDVPTEEEWEEIPIIVEKRGSWHGQTQTLGLPMRALRARMAAAGQDAEPVSMSEVRKPVLESTA